MAIVTRPWTTGPVAVFVTVPFAGSYVAALLGHGREAPQIIETWRWKPFRTDLGGEVPQYRIYTGCEARVLVTLTAWNESIMAAMEISSLKSPDLGRGMDGPGSVGLLVSPQYSPQLWLLFTRVVAMPRSYRASAPQGYHFFCANLSGPRVYQPGPGANSRGIIWDCIRATLPTIPGDSELEDPSSLGLRLYDHNMQAVINEYDFEAYEEALPQDSNLSMVPPLPSELEL